jgi:enoyl-[acyl-carrier protein] reductase I
MNDTKGLMAGKRGLIMGVANNRSIAWGIAQACARHGAELAFTYQGDAIKKRVEPLAAEIGAKLVVPCDVTDMASVDATFAAIEKAWGKLDFVVHAIAFSDKDELIWPASIPAPTTSQTMFISASPWPLPSAES